jgi:hypothetical protein
MDLSDSVMTDKIKALDKTIIGYATFPLTSYRNALLVWTK